MGYDPKGRGEITEAVIIAELLKRDKFLLKPFGDNQRYDLVIEEEGKFLRVQCKTGRYRNGCVTFAPRSSYAHRGRGTKHYRGDAELFAVYCPEIEKVYIIPVNDVGVSTVHLRIMQPRNNMEKNVRWAKDYEIDKVFPR
jgi:hypothetical protein